MNLTVNKTVNNTPLTVTNNGITTVLNVVKQVNVVALDLVQSSVDYLARLKITQLENRTNISSHEAITLNEAQVDFNNA